MKNSTPHIVLRLLAALSIIAVVLPLFYLPEASISPMPEPERMALRKPFLGVNESQVDAVLHSLSVEEKIGQLILWKIDLWDATKRPAALQRAAKGRVGGILLDQLEVGDFVQLTDTFQRASLLPLFVATEEKVSLHGQFFGLPQFPAPTSIAAIDSARLQSVLEKHYLDQCEALGINLSFQPTLLGASVPWQQQFEQDTVANYYRSQRQIDGLTNRRVLAVADGLSSADFMGNDTVPPYLLVHTRDALPGLRMGSELFSRDSSKLGVSEDFLRKKLDFNGLAIVELPAGVEPGLLLQGGADQLITADADLLFFNILSQIEQGTITEQQLDRKVRRILLAKSWVSGGRLPVEFEKPNQNEQNWVPQKVAYEVKSPPRVLKKIKAAPADLPAQQEKLRCYFEDPAWKFFVQTLFEQSVVLATNFERVLPFRDLLDLKFTVFEFEGSSYRSFEEYALKYADYDIVRQPKMPLGGLPPVRVEPSSIAKPAAIILLDGPNLNPVTDAAFINSVNDLVGKAEVVVVNFGNPKNLQQFVQGISLLQVFERNESTERYVAQALFGGVPIHGKLPMQVSENLPFASSEAIYKTRVSYGSPERSGILQERLVGINAIAETAIDKRAFPGCEVVVIKDGNVIFSNAFGFHTYDEDQPVHTNDLYDIASITKVASTTLSMMKLYDQDLISPSAKVGTYIDLKGNSSLANVRIKNLMIHYSGLPPSMPIGKYFNYRSVPGSGCNDLFCKVQADNYDVPITSHLFFRNDYRDTIWNKTFRMHPSSRKGFRYSDVNFYVLQKIVEERTHEPLDAHVNLNFYGPLGLRTLTYNPLEHFEIERIVPTERDILWRKELVHGYVHDPSAALMGGVGGNAGLFSSAEDLAVVFQMLINDGVYGGIQFLHPGTVEEFTTAKYGNHRGLGFDKPVNRSYSTYSRQAPKSTFGHNGFTGTCVWADPDNKLVYVFLSNRVHPSANNAKIFTENVRGRIHDVVYHAFGSFEGTLPELD